MPGPGTSATAIHAEPALPGPVLLDITRSLSRIDHAAPTGIDRVESAWIRHVAGQGGRFLAAVPGGPLWLEAADALRVLAEGATAPLDLLGRLSRRPVAVARAASLVRALGRRGLPAAAVYANVGHANLTEPGMRAVAGMTRLVMIHDTIPLDHPELASPGSVPRFAARLRAAALADRIVTPSTHSAERVADWLARWGLPVPPVAVVPLGIDPGPAWAPADQPHFVALGTIEPRKGHDLLLDVWAALGPDAPRLHVVGRTGWADPALVAALRAAPRITVHGALPDAEVGALMSGARALLMPSLAEGFGLPAAEAAAMGLPALLSDLPALRAIGGPLATFLPPRDRGSWLRAVEAATKPRSGSVSLTGSQAPVPIFWARHFAEIARFLT